MEGNTYPQTRADSITLSLDDRAQQSMVQDFAQSFKSSLSQESEPCPKHCVKQCSLCGGIYHNIVFRGGFVCEDCIDLIRHEI